MAVAYRDLDGHDFIVVADPDRPRGKLDNEWTVWMDVAIVIPAVTSRVQSCVGRRSGPDNVPAGPRRRERRPAQRQTGPDRELLHVTGSGGRSAPEEA